MIIAFAWTTDAYLSGTKTVTRRKWTHLHARMWVNAWKRKELRHDAYSSNPRSGGVKIGEFDLTTCPYQERLGDITEAELLAEGGLWKSREDFINLLGGDPDRLLWVIRFKPIFPD